MLEKLLHLDRPLFVVDCETTSLDVQQARIIELAFQMFDAAGLVKEYRTLVDPGVPIPGAVEKLTGIAEGDFESCRVCHHSKAEHKRTDIVPADEGPCEEFKPWPTFKQLADSLSRGFKDCDYCGCNVKYDLRVIATEMQRANVEWSYAGARLVDVNRIEALGEPRSLKHLHRRHLGYDFEGAHTALADVRATIDVLAAQLKKFSALPRDLGALHDAQFPGEIDPDGKFRFVDGVACVGNWGKHAGKPMSHPDLFTRGRDKKNYYEFILGADFSADVKRIAADALAGVFPKSAK